MVSNMKDCRCRKTVNHPQNLYFNYFAVLFLHSNLNYTKHKAMTRIGNQLTSHDVTSLSLN